MAYAIRFIDGCREIELHAPSIQSADAILEFLVNADVQGATISLIGEGGSPAGGRDGKAPPPDGGADAVGDRLLHINLLLNDDQS